MSLVVIDKDASTVEIHGRRFPAIALIVPLTPDEPDRSEADRALGGWGADRSVYVPAENGLLIRVEEAFNEHHHGISLDLAARTCEKVWSVDEWIYLPWSVGLVDGDLISGSSNLWYWAEPDWVVETIDRVARKPFTQPDGPLVQPIRLSHFAGCEA